MTAEWRPIETAPKDGTPIIVYMPWEGGMVRTAHYSRRLTEDRYAQNVWCVHWSGSYKSRVAPTHWMPLPPPPPKENPNDR